MSGSRFYIDGSKIAELFGKDVLQTLKGLGNHFELMRLHSVVRYEIDVGCTKWCKVTNKKVITSPGVNIFFVAGLTKVLLE